MLASSGLGLRLPVHQQAWNLYCPNRWSAKPTPFHAYQYTIKNSSFLCAGNSVILSHQYNTLLYWYTNLLPDSDSILAYAYYRSFCMPPSRLRRLYISASDYSASYILSLTSLWGEDKVIRYFFERDKMKVSER